jgi:hypothetical protein
MARTSRNALHDARGKLAEYTDRLWAGRGTASTSLSAVYAERLAAAAKMASMMQLPNPGNALVDLFRKENHAFPRDLLVTDAGRDARSAFNALGRAIRALEEFKLPAGHFPSGLELIVGERLSAVTFVLDYIQLAFDGPGFTVLSPIQIQTPNRTVRTGENGFRDGLCEAIGHTVKSFAIDDRALNIELDGYRITIDLAASSAGPEKLLFDDGDGRLTVWN